ncbi:uncharacterized protein F5Z01DRAFT_174115 [Emericellopsis atlantica]|uniref:Uncharacterized protein n=1 Tax=Emericellopsis atlantica TaxID=2614577 RepID=A0A9P7ZJZ9_9HYPO|nr:uncharacterized protein F5Z01DRAFT_174115 [Emericellopsis atlantica]KAG9253082.1 hypothetical protein F5Z01DRAFT_174115 [Emericellopsis atlantica]
MAGLGMSLFPLDELGGQLFRISRSIYKAARGRKIVGQEMRCAADGLRVAATAIRSSIQSLQEQLAENGELPVFRQLQKDKTLRSINATATYLTKRQKELAPALNEEIQTRVSFLESYRWLLHLRPELDRHRQAVEQIQTSLLVITNNVLLDLNMRDYRNTADLTFKKRLESEKYVQFFSPMWHNLMPRNRNSDLTYAILCDSKRLRRELKNLKRQAKIQARSAEMYDIFPDMPNARFQSAMHTLLKMADRISQSDAGPAQSNATTRHPDPLGTRSRDTTGDKSGLEDPRERQEHNANRVGGAIIDPLSATTMAQSPTVVGSNDSGRRTKGLSAARKSRIKTIPDKDICIVPVEPCKRVTAYVSRPGLHEAARPVNAILDPSLEFNLISLRTARDLDLKIRERGTHGPVRISLYPNGIHVVVGVARMQWSGSTSRGTVRHEFLVYADNKPAMALGQPYLSGWNRLWGDAIDERRHEWASEVAAEWEAIAGSVKAHSTLLKFSNINPTF